MTELVIETKGLGRTYRIGDVEVPALRDADLAIERGEFVAIMGPSGSGKSTLMNLLGCLDRPSDGHYFFEGVDVAALDEAALAEIRSERLGFVFQSFNLLARTSAIENVALPLFYAGVRQGRLARARAALGFLGLGDRERNHPSQLSGGQQQRVAIARALINDPAVLLADEPTGNLDSRTTREIMATIRVLNRQRGVTVIVVTHERDVAAYADRVITMRDGEIVSDERQAAVPADLPQAEPPAEAPTAGSAITASFGLMILAAAAQALARNKLRSVLTMLGVFIGVAALIAMVAIGEGASAEVKKQLESLGTNLLVVVPGATTASGVRAGFGSATALRATDAEAIRHEAPSVASVAYQVRGSGQTQSGDRNWSTTLQGVTPSYLGVTNWTIDSGRNIEDGEFETAAMVCILGETVRENLFPPGQDPIGARILVKGMSMRVIGVLKSKGQSAFGQDQDDIVMMPFTTAERKVLGVAVPLQSPTSGSTTLYPQAANPFGTQPRLTGFVQTLYVQARSAELVQQAIAEVTLTLARQHRIRPGAPNDFSVRNLSQIAEAAEGSSRILELLLATVASISLIVGGIGIMNILLVSVTERTREIGIRMAIGARRRHVLVQFLVEAVLLSATGGGAGVLAGVAATELVAAASGWPTLLSPGIMLGAFLFSAAIGVFFGFYPARKAALLDPIEALRYE